MYEQLQRYVSWLLVQYDHFKQVAYTHLLLYWPRFDNYNHFEKFIILNLIIIGTYLLFTFLMSISPKRIYSKFMEIIFNLPPVRKYINNQLDRIRVTILKDFPANLRPQIEKIPYKPPEITLGDVAEKETLKGKTSGSRYAPQHHSKFVINLAKQFAYANPLHVDTFPLVKQMELEVIAMTADVIGLKDQNGQPCGTLNSGGTESILMALFTYREYKMKECGVIKPNLVLCKSGHAAAIKACQFFDIEPRFVPYDSNYQMHIRKMKCSIDENTICVYTSYPNFPFGTADPIDVIAPYCHKRGIPVHTDMCLGGFVSPFIEENWKLPTGVTSVSVDPHKYGLSGKGVSVLLFSSEKYRKHQFFVTTFWPGGLYGTPGLAGSRSGVYIASAWISMMKLGRKGYQQNARLIHDTLVKVSEQLLKLGFEMLGKHKICVLSFVHKTFSTNSIQIYMKEKGWGLSVLLRHPMAFQYTFTPLNCLKADQMIKDMKECIQFCKTKGAPKKEVNEIALYGACMTIKDDGKKELVLSTVLDTYIDLY